MKFILKLCGYRTWEQLNEEEKKLWQETYNEYLQFHLKQIRKINKHKDDTYAKELRTINIRNLRNSSEIKALQKLNKRTSHTNKMSAYQIARKEADKKLKLLS